MHRVILESVFLYVELAYWLLIMHHGIFTRITTDKKDGISLWNEQIMEILSHESVFLFLNWDQFFFMRKPFNELESSSAH